MAPRRRKLKDLAADPRFISGIYNYCDRWCERCPATARCLVYAANEDEDQADRASRDISNQAFWRRIEGMLREAEEMLREMMQEHGIELSAADLEAEQAREQRLHDDVQRHPCTIAAADYGDAVSAWFDRAAPRLQARHEALAAQRRLELPGADPEGEAHRLNDATEVVRWYQYQIGVKIMRALGSALQAEEEPEAQAGPRDADGSAKVALLGIDRSVVAWSEVLRQVPEEEDELLPLLAGLSRLRREVEAGFPAARGFLRPGFDTGELDGAAQPLTPAEGRPSA
ncbi:MAG: hypothetical protein ACE147_02980 [Candidatus Methylomirabilales bacterium]